MKLPDFALNRANRILRDAPTELPSLVEKAAQKLRKLSRRDLKRLPLLVEFLKYTVTGHYRPSTENLAIVLGGVIYFLVPLDLVPDFIPIAGFLDDVSVIAWCCVAAKEELDRFSAWLAKVTGEIEVVNAV